MAKKNAVDGQAVAAVESDKPKKKAAKKKRSKKKIVPKKDAESTVTQAKGTSTKTKAAKAKAGAAKAKADKAKTANGESKPASDAAVVDPFEVAKQTMKDSVPAIVQTMVRKATAGSCTHAKTLLEMTGAKRMFDGEAPGQDSGEPWAKLVLERLDEAESPTAQDGAEIGSLTVQS